MAKNEPLKRYFYEIEFIRTKTVPSLKEIVYYLENRDVYTSIRTAERDIEQIRNNFGINIIYDPLERGYYIDEDTSPNLQSFMRFLEIANTADILLKGIKQTKDFIKDIEFDLRGGLLGTENLRMLLEAVNNLKKIQFTHYNYLTNKETKVLMDPYFLKEYLGRWYIVGLRDDNEIRTYGIDRITELAITKEGFDKTKEAKARANFDSIIGLVYSYGKPQRVILSFTPQQGRYVKSLQWHHSQKILVDNETEFRISLFVIPNYELFQQILMHGADVEVIEPEWLRKDIKSKIMDALLKYK
jgi:predicted DNA-binding transcriptional regulator YafY